MQEAALEAFSSTLKDIMLFSATGSGKTLAFLLPLIDKFDATESTEAIVVCPSRELAQQIDVVFKSLGTPFKSLCCYGGHAVSVEKRSLKHAPKIIISTPGRLLDHIENDVLKLDAVKTIIIDEFDKSLELGFYEEMARIFDALKTRAGVVRKVFTSATEAVELPAYTGVEEPLRLDFIGSTEVSDRLTFSVVECQDKHEALYNLLCTLEGAPTLIFCNFRESAEGLSSYLLRRDVVNEFFHGGMEQPDRDRSLVKLRNGSANILVATDLAARGLDIPSLRYIIHFELPQSEAVLTHRNGRTARMSATGEAFILLDAAKDYLPVFITDAHIINIPEPQGTTPVCPEWCTLYIAKGRKDKLSKTDIVGLFCIKGGLAKEDIGMIELKDYYSFVAVKSYKAHHLLETIKGVKIKGMGTRFSLAR